MPSAIGLVDCMLGHHNLNIRIDGSAYLFDFEDGRSQLLHILNLVKKVIKLLLSSPIYDGLLRLCRRSDAISYASKAKLSMVSKRPSNMFMPIVFKEGISYDISIIVPVYNVEKYLKPCLDSIVTQEFSGKFEVIIVDDGSKDDSGVIADSYGLMPNVLVIHQINGGLSAARNAGLRVSRGKYIMFVDSDDMIGPGYLEDMRSRLDETSADFVTSTFRYMSDDGLLGEIENDRASWMVPWGRLYRREVWNRLGFPVGAWYEDLIHPVWIDCRFNDEPCYDLSGYYYRIRPGSIMQSTPTNVKGLDSYWVLDELISLRAELGINYSQEDFNRIFPLFGPLLLGRTVALDNCARKILFACCCDTFNSIDEFSRVSTSMNGRWKDIEKALRTSDYSRYLLASLSLAADGVTGLSLSDAIHIWVNRNR